MSTLATNHITLVDVLKQTVGDSIESDIAEILAESNALLADAHVMECNDGSSHKSVIRHGLPKGVFRKLYGYVPTEKSTTEQVVDKTGSLESYSTIDVDLVKESKNPAQLRLNEAVAFIEGMGQTAQETIIYGNKTDDDAEFDGLAVRYGNISKDKNKIGYNVIDAGGTGSNNTSIWFITWGENHTALLYPKGSKAGIEHTDDGIQTETNEKGHKRKVYQDHFQHKLGVTVKNFKSTCRISNIDVNELAKGNVDLLKLLRKGYFRVKKYANTSGTKTFVYCNDTIAEYLDAAAADKSNIQLSFKQYGGEDITHYRNFPIREIDQILNTEERVTEETE